MRLHLEWCERNEHPVELTRAQIQQYAAELIAAGRLTASPTSGRALVEACMSSSFRGKRDEAIVRLMAETGLRASQTVALTVADVQPLKNGVVAVRPARA